MRRSSPRSHGISAGNMTDDGHFPGLRGTVGLSHSGKNRLADINDLAVRVEAATFDARDVQDDIDQRQKLFAGMR